MISRYQGNIGCCGRFDCRKEGGKNIHRTKGNVMKSVRLGHALQEEGDTIYVSLWEERPLPGIQPSFLFVSVHLITAIPPPLVPSPFSLKCGLRQDPGGERREKKGGKGRTNEWRRRKERMSCLPLEKRDRPIRMDKKAFPLSLPLSLLENETVSGLFV